MMGYTCVWVPGHCALPKLVFQVFSHVNRLNLPPHDSFFCDSSVSPFTASNPFSSVCPVGFSASRQQGGSRRAGKSLWRSRNIKLGFKYLSDINKTRCLKRSAFFLIWGVEMSLDSPLHPQIITTLPNLSPRTRCSSTSSKR